MTAFTPRHTGQATRRAEAVLKVTGGAPYAAEVGAAQGVHDAWHAALVLSRVAAGRVLAVDAADALAEPGVEAVWDHTNAPRLSGEDREYLVLQSERIEFRGQIVAIVLARTSEAAREGARLVRVQEEPAAARTRFDLAADFGTDEEESPETLADEREVLAALSGAQHTVDVTYSTPPQHNNPMEPHAIVARWNERPGAGPRLEGWWSTQSVTGAAKTLATTFDLEPDEVRVRCPYVGGGFGCKGELHAPDIAAALAARAHPGRWVRLSVTRQQMFALTGYRAPTIARMRLGADAEGRLQALDMTAYTQVSTVKRFVEGATGLPAMMYAADRRRLRQQVTTLNVAVTSWMRAPGEMPGAHALECALDELAHQCGLDPIELRIRNDVEVDPENGKPFNNRRLVECLRLGAQRFGWSGRGAPGATRDGDCLVGLGVASATYPALVQRGTEASIQSLGGDRYRVRMGSADLGQGAWTVLAQIAADALGVGLDDIDLELGDSAGPPATVAGGSSGTASWGAAIIGAAVQFREKFGDHPEAGDELQAGGSRPQEYKAHSMHSFGAHFVEVRVHEHTGEVRVPRMLGVFSVGRVLNPTLVRSQFIGGMVMGIGAALHEGGVRDDAFGHIVTQDLASYHVPAHADIADVDAIWLDEFDPLMGPLGARGVGEIGIVGASAAVANAVFNATGVRVRDLPITPSALAAASRARR